MIRIGYGETRKLIRWNFALFPLASGERGVKEEIVNQGRLKVARSLGGRSFVLVFECFPDPSREFVCFARYRQRVGGLYACYFMH